MNWADQSSDEDSDDGLHPMRLSAHNLGDLDEGDDGIDNGTGIDNDLSYDESGSQRPDDTDLVSKDSNLELEEEKIPYPSEIDFDKVPEDFPRQPPFTAHIRNLAFKISTPEELTSKIEGLVSFRYKGDKRVNVKDARLGMDRKTGQRKGFGYVEFDTEKELMILLNINDGFSRVNGRPIEINIARPPQNRNNNRGDRGGDRRDYNNMRGGDRNGGGDRGGDRSGGGDRGGGTEIDGSKFRGGFSRNNNRGGGRGGDNNSNNKDAPRERPSLKLAPRSRPVASGDGKEKSPADGGEWSRADRVSSDGGRGRGRGDRGDRRQNNNSNGGSGRNNNGGGRGKKDGGRGGQSKGRKASGKEAGASSKAAPVAANPVKVVEDKKVAKVANKFAALLDDSDSD
eukprot:CAMPEP_0194109130 /NCGR_PEP_ID=MMETSP0150-20130528/8701_1 /TAXON_ID=122233 /ORGANISM="Chaetoceros debilis, Strain MM31A-1" /LENGTH=397 /DNA_ID=CAMNT_0038798019 /DNA_START=123 /DNA_END=1316 /DNA_ORIENTATION=+